MESRAHAIAAGLFTVLLGLGVIFAALWFSRDDYDKVAYVLESKHSVSGLNPEAPVRLRGVQVGKVQSIDFDEADPRMILITILVKGGTRITKGTTAQLGSLGITGSSYVMLEDDGKKPNFLPPMADRIPVKRSLLDTVATSGEEILYDVLKVAKQLQTLLGDENQAKLLGMVGAVQQATERIAALSQSLEPAAKSMPGIAQDARKLMVTADGAVRDIAPAIKEAKNALASIDKLARDYAQRADALDRVAKSAEQIGAASQGVAGSVSGAATEVAPRMNALLEELARNSRNLDRLLTELNEQPSGLVFGRPSGRPGPGETGYSAPQR